MVKLFKPYLNKEIYQAVNDVLDSGVFVKGPKVKEFEELWAKKCKMKYCVATGSGALALEIVCQILKPVTTQSWTYKAVWNAMDRILGGHDFNSFNPDIYAHHLHDQPPKYKPMIEDCSHCHGYRPKSDTAIFSFFPTKILGACGDAGCIVTNDATVDRKARELRDHGSFGTNARMDEIQGAVLLSKLPYLDEYIEKRKQIVDMYDQALHRKTKGRFHYVYAIPGNLEKVDKLLKMGIESKLYYDDRFMALPLYPELTVSEVKEVIKCVQRL